MRLKMLLDLEIRSVADKVAIRQFVQELLDGMSGEELDMLEIIRMNTVYLVNLQEPVSTLHRAHGCS